MGQAGSAFPFRLGASIDQGGAPGMRLFEMHQGTHPESGADVTIFVFEKAHHAQNEDRVNAARNVLKRLKALRHPHMLKFVDGVETETQIFVVVDAVQPLRFRATTLSPPVMAWGFHQIASALAFLHNDCKMIHANVHPGSLYCDRQGNWKLGGFELLYDIAAEGAPASTRRNSDLCPEQFADPYITAADWAMLAASPPSTADSWSLAALLYDAFQGPLLRRDQLAQLGKIPATLQAEYKKLMSQQVKTRLAVSAFLNSTFFAQQPFVRTMLFLEQMALKTPEEKDNFFQSLLEVIPTLPAECNRNYLLPQLRASIDFGAAVHPRALTCVLRLGSQLAAEDFAESIAPMLVKLFASNERQMRLCLLQHLPEYGHLLDEKTINESIIPHLVTGFVDAAPQLRESTVKAVLPLAAKITEANWTTHVLPHLDRLQTEKEPSIRTNTTICLGKCAPHLSAASRTRVLAPAFTRALKDPFAPARGAALMALGATVDYYAPDQIVRTILPQIGMAAIDPNRDVRNACLRTLGLLTTRLQKNADAMCEAEAAAAAANAAKTGNAAAATAASAQDAASSSMLSSLGSWAMSSFSRTVLGSAGEEQMTAPNTAAVPVSVAQSGPVQQSHHAPARATPSSTPTAKPMSMQKKSVSAVVAGGDDGWGDAGDDNFFDDLNDDDQPSEPVAAMLSTSKKPTTGASAAARPTSAIAAKSKSILSSSAAAPAAPAVAAAPKVVVKKPSIVASADSSDLNDSFGSFGSSPKTSAVKSSSSAVKSSGHFGGKASGNADTDSDDGLGDVNAWDDDDMNLGDDAPAAPVSLSTAKKPMEAAKPVSSSLSTSALKSADTKPVVAAAKPRSILSAAPATTAAPVAAPAPVSKPSVPTTSTPSATIGAVGGASAVIRKAPAVASASPIAKPAASTIAAKPAAKKPDAGVDDWNSFLND